MGGIFVIWRGRKVEAGTDSDGYVVIRTAAGRWTREHELSARVQRRVVLAEGWDRYDSRLGRGR